MFLSLFLLKICDWGRLLAIWNVESKNAHAHDMLTHMQSYLGCKDYTLQLFECSQTNLEELIISKSNAFVSLELRKQVPPCHFSTTCLGLIKRKVLSS